MYEQLKPVVMLAETSLTNGASTTARVDTLGSKRLTLVLRQSTSNSTSNNLATCRLLEGSTTTFSEAVNMTPFVGDGAGGFTIPAADTSNPQLYEFNVDLLGRERYIFLEVSPVTTQTFTAVALLSQNEQNIATAAHLGIAALIEG